MVPQRFRDLMTRAWPWLGLALAAGWAVSTLTTFESGPDPEFPGVVRPTYSPRPPFAYRVSEPGDTLDRVAMYAASVGLVLSVAGWVRAVRGAGRVGLWPTATALMAGAWWFAAVPLPTPDGWHGIGWASLVAHNTPGPVRGAVGLAGMILLAMAAWPWVAILRSRDRGRVRGWIRESRRRGMLGLAIVAVLLIAGRAVTWPGIEPSGFWPRWSLAMGLILLDVGLLRAFDRPSASLGRGRWAARAAMAAGVAALVIGGRGVIGHHVPVERLAEVVPGRIFVSAIPSGAALETVIQRHGIRTVINLFPEDTPQRSPLWPGEERVIREHGLKLLQSTSDASRARAFLDETLRMAQDPEAWPVLVHCHACMDRTPAWLGVYRFVVEGRSLDSVMREIERKRGLRPKATVSMMFARELARLAPERFARDADTPALVRNVAGGSDRIGGGEPESTLTHLSDGTADRSTR